jgi:hypothetical protein
LRATSLAAIAAGAEESGSIATTAAGTARRDAGAVRVDLSQAAVSAAAAGSVKEDVAAIATLAGDRVAAARLGETACAASPACADDGVSAVPACATLGE